MKKVIAALFALIVVFVMFIVVLFMDDDDESNMCTPGGGSGDSGGTVNSEGLAFPTDPEATEFTSGFGERDGEPHNGVDYAGEIDTPIYALADGDVVAAGEASGFGNWVVLDHNIDGEEHSTVYGHMAADQITVDVGDQVKAGDRIAGIGSEGFSTGAHLHFEFYNGLKLSGSATPVDPKPMLDDVLDDGGESNDDKDSDDDSSDDDGGGGDAPSGGDSGEYTDPGQDVSLGVPNDISALDERQLNNVRAIISTGKGRKADDSVIKAAVMAAGPESGYRMLASRAVPESLEHPNDGVTPGDATSVGLYQIQTPMNMPTDEAMDREKHINWFYDTAEEMADPSQEPWEIAADVERPDERYRTKYQQWEAVADKLLETEGDIDPADLDCDPDGGDDEGGSADQSDFAGKAIAAAREHEGATYVWGGGDWNGPTDGGFDCSGLTMYAYAQASGGDIKLEHQTTSQLNDPALEEVGTDEITAGDLVFFGSKEDPHHVGLAISDTKMIHAPDFGQTVTEEDIESMGDLSSVRRVKEAPNEDK